MSKVRGMLLVCLLLAAFLGANPPAKAEQVEQSAQVMQVAPAALVTAPKQTAPAKPAPAQNGAAAKPSASTAPASAAPAPGKGDERVASAEAAPTPGAGVLSRLVVLGASASCGINLPGSLADAMGAAIVVEHESPLDASSVLFFMMDDSARDALVRKAVEHQPSAVVGIDFLFWYGYGDVPEERRLPLLEQGLAILDTFPCPIVISEFPDMSPAVGLMLQASQMPSKETLVALNARLKAWAAERPRVIVVPLVETIARMRASKELKLGKRVLPAVEESRYLQEDKLHPTAEGLAVIACLVTEGLRAHIKGLKAADVVTDPAVVLKTYIEATKDRKPRGLF